MTDLNLALHDILRHTVTLAAGAGSVPAVLFDQAKHTAADPSQATRIIDSIRAALLEQATAKLGHRARVLLPAREFANASDALQAVVDSGTATLPDTLSALSRWLDADDALRRNLPFAGF